jgi:hypothetical protein
MVDRYTPLAEVMELVRAKDTPFAHSLIRQHEEGRTLSTKQHDCAISIANEVLTKQRAADAKRAAQRTDVSKTFELMEKAQIRLARFMLDGHEVKLRRNGQGTSYYALLGDQHLGSVTADGEFRLGQAYKLDERLPFPPRRVAEALRDFGENPIATMAKYGIETGVCGVCGRRLDDPESVARGIGPICAKRLTQ